MAAYVPVTWTTNDKITETKLDNMVANDQSEDAHAANGMIMNNNIAYSAKQAGGSTVDVMKLGTDDVLRLSQLEYDNNQVSTVVQENVMIQTGWGFLTGDNTAAVVKTITFPTAFDTPLGVVISINGAKASIPTDVTDVATIIPSDTIDTAASAYGITTTQFTAVIRRSDAPSNSQRTVFSWIAWGIKA